eukprot:CAMPEP_0206553554 /NCGR_PEP_ID=MMETSP0325_2-20121206/16696_1 /ASSEMBLY_ACC=CAM_ASM_000347 /TAXON_ID=2866 /ORGANISM="Crypthecodinium cohnii, Strain Seligo" /LENGTH=49 /DNA_ID=CAMNT_0054053543 /DNA_START=190 /DNA_END=339 /DNA_ORIENTATION=+
MIASRRIFGWVSGRARAWRTPSPGSPAPLTPMPSSPGQEGLQKDSEPFL